MPTSQAVLLPNNVKPLRYAIHLTPDLDAYTFDGEETIDVEVLEATDTIVLNAAEMSVSAASIMDAGNAAVDASAIELNAADETVSISFPSAIQPGPAVLRIAFTGELNDRLTGFYRSEYTRADGTSRTMATTQFEPSSARRSIPCWDEPALKASFQLTLTIPSDMDAVSNMPPADETVDGDTKTVRFGESPVMSTYLLAFIVSELGMIEQQAEGGTMVRVLTTRGKEEQGRFALETSVALLSYFNDYFGIPYPLEKLDHIAIPDFAAGAMENWGAITYRETALLVDPAISPAATRQRVAEVVSHEMAHMWFGDLVTMQWWDDLWLNESFASWMGDKAVDHIHPEWKMWTQFVANDTIRAFSLDGLKNSHPIEATVHTPAEVEELVRRHQLQQGRIHHPNAGALPYARNVPGRAAPVPGRPPVLERPHGGPLGGAGRGVRQAGEIAHGHVDEPDGLPRPHRRIPTRGRRREAGRIAVAFPVQQRD